MKTLKTKKLLISTMTDDEIRSVILSETDEHRKNELHEVLQACLEHPNDRDWYTKWEIALRDGTVIGDLSFKGPQVNGVVGLRFKIYEDEYLNNGYATDAVEHAINWAFSDNEVYFITTEVEGSDLTYKHILDKLGFAPSESPEEGEIYEYEKERDKTSWMAIFMSLGVCIGLSFGNTIFDNAGTGMCLGMCFGIAIGQAIGLSIDSSDKKKREKLREARNKK